MYLNESKINSLFFYWIFASLVLVFLIIIVGGLTRLTNSGLSIIEWELFKGILPPLTDVAWEQYFEKYKTIPQFKLINFDMVIEEFKVIFYWEYFHRILARFIGLFFLIPLIFFFFTKKIKKKHINTCFLILLLIFFQGIIGWYMVKSGLVNDITVSHYRLSLHLTTALIIISALFWLLINLHYNKNIYFFKFSKVYLPYQFLLIIIFIQIILGAFVSGLDAGKIYQTWPLMGSSFFPDDLTIDNIDIFFDFNNRSLLQFYHRNIAYVIILYVIILSTYIYLKKKLHLYKPLKILIAVLFSQVILGILTLVSGLHIYLASAHQILGVLLVLSAINLYYLNAK